MKTTRVGPLETVPGESILFISGERRAHPSWDEAFLTTHQAHAITVYHPVCSPSVIFCLSCFSYILVHYPGPDELGMTAHPNDVAYGVRPRFLDQATAGGAGHTLYSHLCSLIFYVSFAAMSYFLLSSFLLLFSLVLGCVIYRKRTCIAGEGAFLGNPTHNNDNNIYRLRASLLCFCS